MTEPWIENGSFKFGTTDMYATFGLRVTDCDYDYLSPAPRQRKMEVPLRSGSYRFEEKYHEERQILLSVRSENPVREYWRELSYVLDKTANLYIYSEPEKYYTGRIYDPSQLKRLRNVGVDFDLIFTCKPYAVGLSTTQDIVLFFSTKNSPLSIPRLSQYTQSYEDHPCSSSHHYQGSQALCHPARLRRFQGWLGVPWRQNRARRNRGSRSRFRLHQHLRFF